jgi:hypothetical protein
MIEKLKWEIAERLSTLQRIKELMIGKQIKVPRIGGSDISRI